MKLLALILFPVLLAQAEIPLELIAEFELPAGTVAWDVQHWMDDSTLGCVWLRGDTVWYKTQLGSAPAWTIIRDSLIVPYLPQSDCVEYGDYVIRSPYRLRIANIVGEQRGTAVILMSVVNCQSPYWDYNFEWNVTYPFSLARGEVIAPVAVNQTYQDEICYHGGESRTYYAQFDVWPRPPQISHYAIASGSTEEWCDPTGSDSESRYSSGFVLEISANLTTRSLPLHPILPNWMSPQFEAIGLYYWENITYSDGSPWEMNFHSRARFYDLEGADTTLLHERCAEDTIYAGWEPWIIEQTSLCRFQVVSLGLDEERNPFALLSGWHNEGVCVDANSGVVAWQSSDADTWHAANVAGTDADEFLVWRSGRFDVYSLANGQLIGNTSDFAGDPVEVIVRNEYLPEIKTIDRVAHTVRVYRFVPQTLQMTIAQAELGGQIILRWRGMAGALGYRVCRNLESSDDLCSGGDVYMTTDTTMVLTPWPGAMQEFYRVEPVFE